MARLCGCCRDRCCVDSIASIEVELGVRYDSLGNEIAGALQTLSWIPTSIPTPTSYFDAGRGETVKRYQFDAPKTLECSTSYGSPPTPFAVALVEVYRQYYERNESLPTSFGKPWVGHFEGTEVYSVRSLVLDLAVVLHCSPTAKRLEVVTEGHTSMAKWPYSGTLDLVTDQPGVLPCTSESFTFSPAELGTSYCTSTTTGCFDTATGGQMRPWVFYESFRSFGVHPYNHFRSITPWKVSPSCGDLAAMPLPTASYFLLNALATSGGQCAPPKTIVDDPSSPATFVCDSYSIDYWSGLTYTYYTPLQLTYTYARSIPRIFTV